MCLSSTPVAQQPRFLALFADRAVQTLVFGLGCGMSASYWRNQHNKHHTTPQKLGADPDLQTDSYVNFLILSCRRILTPSQLQQ